MACPVPALTAADVNKTVEIKNVALNEGLFVDGINRAVKWREAAHGTYTGKIMSVETKFKGKIVLANGKVFENPALDGKRPFDPACYRSKLCHSPKVCPRWKRAICSGVAAHVDGILNQPNINRHVRKVLRHELQK